MTDYVISSGVTTGYTLSAGDGLTVLSGGTAENVFVNSGAEEVVVSGGMTANTTVGFGGVVQVEGTAIGTIVSAKGELQIYTGGVGSDTKLMNGGTDAVFNGGSAVSTTIFAGSVELATSGGTVIATQVEAEGTLIAVPGATVEQPTVQPGGFEITSGYAVLISSGGVGTLPAGVTASGQVIYSGTPGFVLPGGNFVSGYITSGAELDVYNGGTASAIIIEPDGTLAVYSGGAVASTTVFSGGAFDLFSGATVLSAAALSGGRIYLGSGSGDLFLVQGSGSELSVAGGSATDVTVINGGVVQVSAGGQTNGAYLDAGGELIVGAGGGAVGAYIYDGAAAVVSAGGLISSFQVYSGATAFLSGGSSEYSTVDAGGTQTIDSGGLANGNEIEGDLVVNSGGEAQATTVFRGGNLLILSGGSAFEAGAITNGVIEIRSGGSVDALTIGSGGLGIADAGANLSGYVYFYGIGGEYVTSNATGLTTISGFEYGDQLVAASLAFVSAGSATLGAGNVLTVSQGTASFTAQFDDSVAGDTFAWSAGSQGATDIYLVPTVTSVTAANSPDHSPSLSATDVLDIGPGGVVNNAYVYSGGAIDVFSGGIASASFVYGATQTVFSGGSAVASELAAGAAETVSSGGATSGAVVLAGGTEQILAGGSGSGIQLGRSYGDGGALTAVSGAVLTGTEIYGGGIFTVSAGASVATVTVNAGGTLIIAPGAAVSGAALDGGTAALASGGTLADPVVNAGLLVVSAGAVLDNPATAGGGTILLLPGGVISGAVASGTAILSSGVVLLNNGGLASAGTSFVETSVPDQGSPLIVLPGGTTSLTRLDDGGLEAVYGGVAIASYLPDGAVQSVGSGGTAAATDLAGGTEIVAAGGQLSSGVFFTGPGAELITYNTSAGTVLSSFNDTSLLDAAALPFVSAGSGMLGAGDVLTVTQGGRSFTAQFGSGAANATFGWSADGAGGTLIRFLYDRQIVSGAGNSAVSAIILTGDEIYALSGGIISDTILDSGGVAYVSAGGTAIGTTLNHDTSQVVGSGGIALSTTLNDDTTQVVERGGAASNTIFDGGTQVLESGVTQSGDRIGLGQEIVSGGAAVVSASVTAGGTLSILGGATASATEVGFEGSEIVQSGGTVSGGTVSGVAVQGNGATMGGNLYVSGGGSAVSVTLLSGDHVSVSAGGTALDTQLGAGARLSVEAGAIFSGTVVLSGGRETVLTGGAASGTLVQAFGTEVLSGSATLSLGVPVIAAGTSYDTQIAAGGEVVAEYGGVASDTQIASGGVLVVSSGGVAVNPDIAGGGAVLVLAGGAVSGVVSGGGEIISTGVVLFAPGQGIISQGATLSGLAVGTTQTAYVLSGGFTTGTYVTSGGYEYIENGGVASATTLGNPPPVGDTFPTNFNAVEFVASGGTAIGTVINGVTSAVAAENYFIDAITVAAGGVISNVNVRTALDGNALGLNGYVTVAGRAVNTTISNGIAQVYSGGIMSNTLVEGVLGAVQFLSGGTLYNTTVTNFGGVDNGYGQGVLSNTVIDNGSVELENNEASGTLDFTGTGGLLLLDYGAAPGTIVSGFVPGDTIGLYGVYTLADVTAAIGPENVLTATAGGETYMVGLDPNADYSHDTISLSNVVAHESNGVEYSDYYTAITLEALCFARGTRIRTPAGEVAVEALNIGDAVVTRAGGAPVKWIGHRDYDGRFIGANHLVLPVTIRRHAIGQDVPARDLVVSPGHGIWLDGVLVPAWRLINGVSITQAESVDRIEYFHIELASHEVIFAEGCPAETYLDADNRQQFQNAAQFAALYPQALHQKPCLPRLEAGIRLQQLQHRLAAWAGLTPPPQRPMGALRGFLDDTGTRGCIAGWAQDAANPEVPVWLDIMLGGRRLRRVLANAYRADLRAAGMGSGCHGFSLPCPGGLRGRITVRRSGDQWPLGLSAAAASRVA